MLRVSVIIPSYNREKLLRATLDSLLAQTYPEWEALVIDDSSVDSSFEVASSYALSDQRIRAMSRTGEKRGACVCRNQGLFAATGDLIVFLDSDDLLSETCLECRVAEMAHHPGCGYGIFQTELFRQNVGDDKTIWNSYSETNDLLRFLSLDIAWYTSGPIWRKPVLEKLGGFDESLLSLQDWALHVRALIAQISYFKVAVRDNFHRYDHGDTNSISSVSFTKSDHLISHEILFSKILSELRNSRLLDNETRNHLAEAFWWLARRWQLTSHINEADRIWQKARFLGLCTSFQYIKGRLIFRLYSVNRGKRLVKVIRLMLPRRLYSAISTETRKVAR